MPAPIGQNNWRFCSKCYALWFNGLETNEVCPAGGSHQATASVPVGSLAGGPASWDYVLIADPALYSEERE